MKIKKYVVSNMQEAMNQIKEDLGPDAVIVSSHKAPKENIWDLFNPGKLIVTAAVEEYKQQVLPPQIELKQIDTKTEIKSDA
ncbi:MAG: flagellar biosynthesis protein FlhF, partial [Tissierellia bacterium]|nr:flagellar biosynthesis protein FlhF [Tissierellia bacterium]